MNETPRDFLREGIEAAVKIRERLDHAGGAGLGPFSREHFNRALAELELVKASLELASMFLARGD